MDLSNPNWYLALGAAALSGVIATFWSQARTIFQQFLGLGILQTNVSNLFEDEVIIYLKTHYKCYLTGSTAIEGFITSFKDSNLTYRVPFQLPPTPVIFRGPQGTFILSDKGSSQGITLTSLRFLSDPLELIRQSVTLYEEKQKQAGKKNTQNEFRVIRIFGSAGQINITSPKDGHSETPDPIPLGSVVRSSTALPLHPNIDTPLMHNREDYLWSVEEDPMKGLFFEKPALELIDIAEHWINNGSWYKDRMIPWRLGFLLYGPGGTGKSSLAAVLGKKLGIRVYQYFLSTLTDKEFSREWNDMTSPCIALLEDIDAVFHGRENITQHKSLSFDTLLNNISGVSSANGVLLIVTTNKVEHVDEALGTVLPDGSSSRPGRIDHIRLFSSTSEDVRRKLAAFILRDFPEKVDDLVSRGENMTIAQFQNLCVDECLNNVKRSQLKRVA